MQNFDILKTSLAKPAQRALENAGVTSLNDFSELSENEVSKLHGIGKNALQKIKQALIDNKLSFAKKNIERV